GPRGDLWGTINGSRMLTQLKAPGSLHTRWLTEDVPYGIAAWALLGEQIGVKTPLLRSLVEVASATVGVDFWKTARTPKDLGMGGRGVGAMLTKVKRGGQKGGGGGGLFPLSLSIDTQGRGESTFTSHSAELPTASGCYSAVALRIAAP